MTLIKRIGRSIRWLKHRVSPGAIILVYHRVVESSNPGQSPMSVTPEALASQLAWLRQHANPISLTKLVHMLRNGQVPKRAVAVTFDDGYANNLYQAKPLLERYDVPATVFVTTGAIDRNQEFWWDELRTFLLRPETLPDQLSLTINGNRYDWTFGSRFYVDNRLVRSRWRLGTRAQNAPTSRESVVRCIHKILKGSQEEERRQTLATISKWAGTQSTARPHFRPMTSDEVLQLAESTLIDIGAHTVTHPTLSSLSTVSQREEISASKRHLEGIIGRPVTAFAYPYGSRRDYTEETVALAQEAGFDCACSNFRDVIFPGVDYYQLPRIPVRSWDEEEFSRRLGLQL